MIMPKGKERTEAEALEYVAQITPLLETGMALDQSCDYAGVSRATVYTYMDKFDKVKTKITTAKMRSIAVAHETMAKASANDWRPALETLRRKDKRWRDKQDVTTDGEAIKGVEVVFIGGEPEQEQSPSS